LTAALDYKKIPLNDHNKGFSDYTIHDNILPSYHYVNI